ncbi:phytoene synthase [Leptolyngbya sp. FACHB-261]|nr:phytoene synthase [Leptolyngbya sp. FACHB-261]
MTILASPDLASVPDAYELCRRITQKYGKTFYLATLLMPKPKRLAIWALYAWCRMTDELVDGIRVETATLETLDDWEKRLESCFDLKPTNNFEVALVDVIRRYPLAIEPFRDMVAGQRMDLQLNRYATFEELHLYCYRVAGTVGLMSSSVMGFEGRDSTQEAVALGIAKQLTNILRDVGEDARRGRIYIPLEDLQRFDYTERELLSYVVDDRWMALMSFQIERARGFYARAESGVSALSRDARWPVWAALMNYRAILDAIERNQYEVFRQRAYVSTVRKLSSLPVAWLRASEMVYP